MPTNCRSTPWAVKSRSTNENRCWSLLTSYPFRQKWHLHFLLVPVTAFRRNRVRSQTYSCERFPLLIQYSFLIISVEPNDEVIKTMLTDDAVDPADLESLVSTLMSSAPEIPTNDRESAGTILCCRVSVLCTFFNSSSTILQPTSLGS